LKFIKNSEKEKTKTSSKRNLLAPTEDEEGTELDETLVWLNLTTKKHIVDQKRLKPAKISLPHPLNISAATTICLITADPQRTYKDIVASPAFPSELRSRITRVIGVHKIKAKFHQYEAQRQLLAEHDIFLADDRIITQLPKLLGKTFYKSAAKRPVPINMQAPAPRTDGKRVARAKGDSVAKETISPQKLSAEIEKALKAALVALSPSTLTSVRVGLAGWPAEKLAENVTAVAAELITKFVPKKWRGVRAIHIKGPETTALPIWLADELWTDEADVLEDGAEEIKAIEAPNVGKKRKAVEAAEEEQKKETKAKKVKTLPLPESNDNNLDNEIALRKERLKKQKAEAAASVEDEVPKPKSQAKRSKKSKAVTVVA
jgi:ribosome biogenesis protein UTP30